MQDDGDVFLTGLDTGDSQFQMSGETNLAPTTTSMPLDELIIQVERQMREYERNAQYLEAEKARQHWNDLRSRKTQNRQRELENVQQEDVRVFLDMVQQHQEGFDATWNSKIREHKLRADDLIEALKWKHDNQQRELYEILRKKRMPKFSVELLNLRKKQVLLARNKKYIQAEKVKRKGDILEAFEIDNIRRAAKEENQIRFKALLKRQHWDRQGLADKLRIEKKQLLEAKAQDFERLKKRLKNAENELKKTHVRQALQSERKLAPLSSSVATDEAPRRPRTWDAGKGDTRKSGMDVYGSSESAILRPRLNGNELSKTGRGSETARGSDLATTGRGGRSQSQNSDNRILPGTEYGSLNPYNDNNSPMASGGAGSGGAQPGYDEIDSLTEFVNTKQQPQTAR